MSGQVSHTVMYSTRLAAKPSDHELKTSRWLTVKFAGLIVTRTLPRTPGEHKRVVALEQNYRIEFTYVTLTASL